MRSRFDFDRGDGVFETALEMAACVNAAGCEDDDDRDDDDDDHDDCDHDDD